jgi:hypothetical protein
LYWRLSPVGRQGHESGRSKDWGNDW